MQYVWYIQGEDGTETRMPTLFDTKEAAEKYARLLFPDEGASKNYMRVMYRPVHTLRELQGNNHA